MSNRDPYDIGDVARVRMVFAVGDVPTNPGTTTLYVRRPSGVVDTYTNISGLVQESTGTFYRDVDCTEAGDWKFFWVGTAPVKLADPGLFKVRERPFILP